MLYIATRLPNHRTYVYKISAAMYAIDDSSPGQALDPRFDLRRHSPTGFEWSYGGSGPAQLALAICADHLKDDELALKVYQYFKANVIAVQPKEGFVMADIYIDEMISLILNGIQGD